MADFFVDISGWAALIDTTERQHTEASDWYERARQQKRKLVTTNYVLTELVSLLISPLHMPRSLIISSIEGLTASPYIEVVHIDPAFHAQAWRLLIQCRDKDWSLVDCSSFVLMQQYGITEAITTDHHFEQAGFIRLLKS